MLQISIAEMGFFRTNFVKNLTEFTTGTPPTRTPQLVGNVTHSWLAKVDPTAIKGDPDKLVKRLYELGNLVDPPFVSCSVLKGW